MKIRTDSDLQDTPHVVVCIKFGKIWAGGLGTGRGGTFPRSRTRWFGTLSVRWVSDDYTLVVQDLGNG